MKKLTFTSNLILAAGILLTTLSAQSMRHYSHWQFDVADLFINDHDTPAQQVLVNPPPLEKLKKYEELTLQAKQYNQNNPFFLIPKEILDQIISCCHIQDSDQVKSLEKSIKIFMKLSCTCKNFNRLLTFETIGNLCKNYALADKNEALKKLITTINDSNYKANRLPGLILVGAGADANTEAGYDGCLLRRAASYSDDQMVEVLFQHNANQNVKNCVGNPLIFSVKTIKIAQMFIDKGVNLHATASFFRTNILWHLIKNTCLFNCNNVELLEFYLKHQVDATQLDDHNSCLLHELAEETHIYNIDNVLKKGELLLNAMPKEMVNTLNKKGQTPVDVALASLEKAKEYAHGTPKALEQLIALYRAHGGLSAHELSQKEL